MEKNKKDKICGSLIGGAIGDALGYPIEFMSLAAIKNKYGKDGIKDFELNEKSKAIVFDVAHLGVDGKLHRIFSFNYD